MASRISSVLPSVGRDSQGEDPWTDPVGVELADGVQIGRIPDCATAPVVKIVLWDERTRPLWEVSGPAIPLQAFFVGVTPNGFKVDTPLADIPAGQEVRLVVIRKDKGAVGLRYRATDLRAGRVVSQSTLSRFTPDGFQSADLCTTTPGGGKAGSSTSTSLLGG